MPVTGRKHKSLSLCLLWAVLCWHCVAFPQRSMLPATRVGHQTQSCRRTHDSISYSVRPAILAAPSPASKLGSRPSQASEHSSVPKLTNLLIDIGFCKVFWRCGRTGLQSEWIYHCIKSKISKLPSSLLALGWLVCEILARCRSSSCSHAHWIFLTTVRETWRGKEEVLFKNRS